MVTQVLLVESDKYQAMLMERWLADANISTAVVGSAAEAVPFFKSDSLLAVVSNVHLPDRSGLDLVQLARANCPWRRILMVTALDSADAAVTALKRGANDFLTKPLHQNRLVSAVRSLIAESEADSQTARRSILAIGAHPDDIEVGVGATLLRHIAAGDAVNMLTLTNGAREGKSGILKLEGETSAGVLGAALFWGGLCDGGVLDGPEVIQIIENHVERLRPHTIYVHSGSDTHADHRATHNATLVACQRTENVFCYQSPSSTTLFSPTRFVDVGLFLEQKVTLLHAYESQFEQCTYRARDFVKATARYWGRFAAYREVEPLEVIRATD
jgi:LmbE family N-acetylglucosaminyl deacetylase/CheY-like chemotaxis protein